MALVIRMGRLLLREVVVCSLMGEDCDRKLRLKDPHIPVLS
jgi:hypothetical protein